MQILTFHEFTASTSPAGARIRLEIQGAPVLSRLGLGVLSPPRDRSHAVISRLASHAAGLLRVRMLHDCDQGDTTDD